MEQYMETLRWLQTTECSHKAWSTLDAPYAGYGLAGKMSFSEIDLLRAYYQLQVAESDIPKTNDCGHSIRLIRVHSCERFNFETPHSCFSAL